MYVFRRPENDKSLEQLQCAGPFWIWIVSTRWFNSRSTKINIMRKRSEELGFIQDSGIQILRLLLNIFKLKEISNHFHSFTRLFKNDFIPGAFLSKKINVN